MALVDLPLQETIVSWPLLLCTIRPMLGNLDSGIRKIFVCGIRNPENFPCEIQPESWALESKK